MNIESDLVGASATLNKRIAAIDIIRGAAIVFMWVVLHQKSGIAIGGQGGAIAFVQYPLIPWVGVMALGYVSGVLFQFGPDRRKKWLASIGIAAVVGFVILRLTNLYGDPAHWSFPINGANQSLAHWQWI